MCITEYDETKTMNMFKEEGREEGREEELFSSIKKLMRTMKLSAHQAMGALEIPPVDQSRYLRML